MKRIAIVILLAMTLTGCVLFGAPDNTGGEATPPAAAPVASPAQP